MCVCVCLCVFGFPRRSVLVLFVYGRSYLGFLSGFCLLRFQFMVRNCFFFFFFFFFFVCFFFFFFFLVVFYFVIGLKS